jgi:hypothetical protein
MYGKLYVVASGNKMYGISQVGRNNADINKAPLCRAFLRCG